VVWSLFTRTPSTYTSGSLDREKLLAPRTRTRLPPPSMPVVWMIATPGDRPFSSSVTDWTGALSTISSAFTVVTVLPRARLVWRPAVPVTTIRSSSMALSSSVTWRSVVPTVASIVSGRKPIMEIRRETSCPVRPVSRNRPSLPVTVPTVVPTTATFAPAIGCCVSAERTIPPMAPWAAADVVDRASSTAAPSPRCHRGALRGEALCE
jgi:hypothetical protein